MESDGDGRFHRPLTVAGTAVRRRRAVGDRQRSAQRLLFATAEAKYDGDLDIDWDAPVDADANWLPERLVSIYGTKVWEALGPHERAELGKHELVNLLTFGVYAECALSMLMFRDIAEGDGLVDDYTRFGLAAINEEARNVTMLSRLINKTGLPPYKRPVVAGLLSRFTMFTPTGPAGRATILLTEEVMHNLVRSIAADPDLQPHVRQLMKIHAMSGVRHVEFARTEVERVIGERGAFANGVHSVAAAAMTAAFYPLLINPRAYRAAGIRPTRGLIAAATNKRYAAEAQALTGSFVRFGVEAGLFEGGIGGVLAKAVLRLGRVWPQDLS